MIRQLVHCCTESTKLLLALGSVALAILAFALGYSGWDYWITFGEWDQTTSIVKLCGAALLILVAILGVIVAFYDEKYSLRALFFLSLMCFLLAAGALFLTYTGDSSLVTIGQQLNETKEMIRRNHNNSSDISLVDKLKNILERKSCCVDGDVIKLISKDHPCIEEKKYQPCEDVLKEERFIICIVTSLVGLIALYISIVVLINILWTYKYNQTNQTDQ